MSTTPNNSSANSDGFLEPDSETEQSLEEEEELLEIPAKRKHGDGKIYLDQSTYQSLEAALQAIKDG